MIDHLSSGSKILFFLKFYPKTLTIVCLTSLQFIFICDKCCCFVTIVFFFPPSLFFIIVSRATGFHLRYLKTSCFITGLMTSFEFFFFFFFIYTYKPIVSVERELWQRN